MRIAVLGHGLIGAGAVSVGKNLLRAMGRAGGDNEYLLTLPENPQLQQVARDMPNGSLLCEPRPYRGALSEMFSRWWWENHRLPAILTQAKPDIILSLSDRGQRHTSCPQAILVHRAMLFYSLAYQRNFASFKDRCVTRYHRRHMRLCLRNRPLIFCQTDVAAERFASTYHYSGPIKICPNSVSRDTVSPETPQIPDKLAAASGRLRLLCLTRYYTHKNVEMLIPLFQQHAEQLRDVVIFVTLDPNRNNAGAFLDKVESLGLSDKIVNVGEISQQELGNYFNNVEALFLPTLLESFTASYCEAMHFGVPILTSDRDFAHAICKQAAVYFEPLDTGSVCEAILNLKSRPDGGSGLVESGRVRLAELTRDWDDIAAQMLADIEEFVGHAGK